MFTASCLVLRYCIAAVGLVDRCRAVVHGYGRKKSRRASESLVEVISFEFIHLLQQTQWQVFRNKREMALSSLARTLVLPFWLPLLVHTGVIGRISRDVICVFCFPLSNSNHSAVANRRRLPNTANTMFDISRW
jgi:hypothetical protein